MNFEEITQRAVAVRKQYDELNMRNGVTWSVTDLMSGFVGDVGDLSKIIMAKQGLRNMDNIDEKLAHELADCLWSVCVLADRFGIDLAAEFSKTMDGLSRRIDAQLQEPKSNN